MSDAGIIRAEGRRKAIACERCHKKKVKCTGGRPCRNCLSTQSVCLFPQRDRLITISENYVRELQSIALLSSMPLTGNLQDADESCSAPPERSESAVNQTLSPSAQDLLPENSTAEAFVSALKKIGSNRLSTDNDDSPVPVDATQPENRENYDYVSLTNDTSVPRARIKLPPLLYAKQLVEQFEMFVGQEYHWYRRQAFRRRLEETYHSPNSENSRDRIWLCKLLVVFALGASYSSHVTTTIELYGEHVEEEGDISAPDSAHPDGSEFFDQALSLLNVTWEDSTLDHVEAFCLMSFYSYSLNRRKAAYMYAGMAHRVACCLLIHKPPAPSQTGLETEHKKRVWWNVFIMETLTASSMGLRSSLIYLDVEVTLPASDQLSSEDLAEFGDHHVLCINLALHDIQSRLLAPAHWTQSRNLSVLANDITDQVAELRLWRAHVPQHLSLDFSSPIPAHWIDIHGIRSIVSIYIRYHQAMIQFIRPVFLKALALVLGRENEQFPLDSLVNLGTECLAAARCNLKVMVWLSQNDRLAKYGFWESLHLFSSITVFSLNRLINTLRPDSLPTKINDDTLTLESRSLLTNMAAKGNFAAKSHVAMLNEIDVLLDRVLTPQWWSEQDILDWFEPLENSLAF